MVKLIDRPGDRPGTDRATRGDQGRDLLGERPDLAARIGAVPPTLPPPPQPHAHLPMRDIPQHPHRPAAAERYQPTPRATHQLPRVETVTTTNSAARSTASTGGPHTVIPTGCPRSRIGLNPE